VSGIPRTFILDRNGKIRLDQSGFGPGLEAKFSSTIETLLEEGE
jgi:hypothetical protein